MNKLKSIYYYFKNKLMLRYIRKHYKPTEKIDYNCYYIVNKYILKTKPDNHIEDYENYIFLVQDNMEQKHFFEQFSYEASEDEKHDIAAIFTLIKLLIFSSDSIRNKYYEMLKDCKELPAIKRYIELGIIF